MSIVHINSAFPCSSKQPDVAGDVPVNYSIAAPTLYNITYHLTAENFLGNSNAAQDTYTAQSYMFLDIFQTTSNVTFNSKDLNYSQISYTVGSGPGTCLCGTLSSCTTTNCSSVLTPSGYVWRTAFSCHMSILHLTMPHFRTAIVRMPRSASAFTM